MKINLLKLPSVDPTSVIIRDITGIIVFERELDYILQDRGNYIEIRRIPGGLIADNSTVLIDYTAMQPGTYHFDSNTHVINSAVYLFKNVFLLNYRFSMQDYSNLEGTEFVTLNYFTQNLIGCRLDFGFLNAGVEYEDYKSSILPYKKTRYYLNLQKNIGKNLIAMLNGNMQNFIMLDEPLPKYQKYLDLNGKITCSLFGQTKLNLNVMYRNQSGRGIDLNLLTAKAEVTSVFSHLFLAVGVEVYRRNYIGEVINFKGTYVRISRKF
jgi:hypothetical protein